MIAAALVPSERVGTCGRPETVEVPEIRSVLVWVSGEDDVPVAGATMEALDFTVPAAPALEPDVIRSTDGAVPLPADVPVVVLLEVETETTGLPEGEIEVVVPAEE